MSGYDKDLAILEKVLMYCGEIDDTVKRFGDDFEIFEKDVVYRNACALCILQIGELCKALSLDFRKTHAGMPWSQIRGMRNVVAHAYGAISVQTTWDTIQQDIPALRDFCGEILKENKKEVV